jgi:hypothetical protein
MPRETEYIMKPRQGDNLCRAPNYEGIASFVPEIGQHLGVFAMGSGVFCWTYLDWCIYAEHVQYSQENHGIIFNVYTRCVHFPSVILSLDVSKLTSYISDCTNPSAATSLRAWTIKCRSPDLANRTGSTRFEKEMVEEKNMDFWWRSRSLYTR